MITRTSVPHTTIFEKVIGDMAQYGTHGRSFIAASIRTLDVDAAGDFLAKINADPAIDDMTYAVFVQAAYAVFLDSFCSPEVLAAYNVE